MEAALPDLEVLASCERVCSLAQHVSISQDGARALQRRDGRDGHRGSEPPRPAPRAGIEQAAEQLSAKLHRLASGGFDTGARHVPLAARTRMPGPADARLRPCPQSCTTSTARP
jgi:hypothetical protein